MKNTHRKLLSGHQDFLLSDAGRGRLVSHKGKCEIADDYVHCRKINKECNDSHAIATIRIENREDLAALPEDSRPSSGGNGPVKSSKNLTIRSIILSSKNLTIGDPNQGTSSARSDINIHPKGFGQRP